MKRAKRIGLAIGLLAAATLACDRGQQPATSLVPQPTTLPLAPTFTPVPPTAHPTPLPATATPTDVPGATLEIVNASAYDIWYVYLAPSFSDAWGDDWLAGQVIGEGQRVTLTGIPRGTYDVRAENAEHDVLATWFNQTLDGSVTWEVSVGDGSGWIPRLDQWAISATASSARSEVDWSAQQATGPPDTPACGDHPTAWASTDPDGVDWLHVGYLVPVIPGRINVHETHSPGFIVRVEVEDVDGAYHTVWEGEPAPIQECPRIFSIPVVEIDVPVVGVRVHLDQRAGGDWDEIDAVELRGIEG